MANYEDLGFEPAEAAHEDVGFEPAPPQGPQVGTGGAALQGVGQGLTLGHADELGGAEQAGLMKLVQAMTPGMRKALGIPEFITQEDSNKTYKEARNENRGLDTAAQAQHGTAYGAGDVAGGALAQGLATAATGGTSLGGQLAIGGTLGALRGEGDAAAHDAAGLKQTVAGGLGGTLAGGLGYGAGKVAQAGLQGLANTAVPLARRAIAGGGSELSEEAVQRALQQGLVGGSRKAMQEGLNTAAKTSGKAVGELLDSAVAVAPAEATADVGPVLQKWEQLGAQRAASTLGAGGAGDFGSISQELARNAPGGKVPVNLLQQMYESLASGKMTPERQAMAADLKSTVDSAMTKLGQATDPEVAKLGQQYAPAVANKALDASNAAASSAAQDKGMGRLPFFGLKGYVVNKGLAAAGGVGTRAEGFLANTFGKVGAVLKKNPRSLGPFASVLTSAAARGPEALSVAHFILGQSNPSYQKKVSELEE